MLDWLNGIDTWLFYFINVTLSNPATDFAMPIITADDYLRWGYGLTLALCLWKGDTRLRWLVLFSGITLTLTDQISSNLLKHAIERIRPCHVLDNINLLVGCGGGYAMPSSHAANSFGQAVLFGFFYKRVRWLLYTIAVLVAISRVFVGVHYPGDITVGALLGAAIAAAAIWLYFRFENRFVRSPMRTRGRENNDWNGRANNAGHA